MDYKPSEHDVTEIRSGWVAWSLNSVGANLAAKTFRAFLARLWSLFFIRSKLFGIYRAGVFIPGFGAFPWPMTIISFS